MYNQAELNLSIDTLVLKLEIKPCTVLTKKKNFILLEEVFKRNGIPLNRTCISEQNSKQKHIIQNQFGSGIASIHYDLISAKHKMFTKYYLTINLYGMNQVYNENNQFQQEHKALIRWIMQLEYKSLQIKKIDIAIDHHGDYENTIIKYNNNTEHQIKQHNCKISTITTFKTKYIYIEKSLKDLIQQIIKKSKIKILEEDERASAKNEYYCWILRDEFRIEKRYAEYIKFVVKNEDNYWKIYHLVHQVIDKKFIKYSSFINFEDLVVFNNRDKGNQRIINYDKKNREIEKIKEEMAKNKHQRRLMFNEKMEILSEKHNVNVNNIGWSRTEITLRNTIDIETKLKQQIKKLSIHLFKSNSECKKYKTALKKNKKTKLKDYNQRELIATAEQVETLIEDLKLLFTFGV